MGACISYADPEALRLHADAEAKLKEVCIHLRYAMLFGITARYWPLALILDVADVARLLGWRRVHRLRVLKWDDGVELLGTWSGPPLAPSADSFHLFIQAKHKRDGEARVCSTFGFSAALLG